MGDDKTKIEVQMDGFFTNLGLGPDETVAGYRTGSQSGKEKNEDSYWPNQGSIAVYHPVDYLIAGRLYLVADGVSRGLNGHEASQLAVQTIAKTYYEQVFQLDRYPTDSDMVQSLEAAIVKANQKLLRRSGEQRRQRRLTDTKSYLQTTVICALLRGQSLIIASVGDSRLYGLRNDHSNTKVKASLLSEDQLGPNRHFVGTHLKQEQIFVSIKELTCGDALILCSDGLYKYLAPDNDPDQAGAIIEHDYKVNYDAEKVGIESFGYNLLIRADDPSTGGGEDNITVVVVQTAKPLSDVHCEQHDIDQAIKSSTNLAWWIDNQSQEKILGKLSDLCVEKAKQLVGKEKVNDAEDWFRRAAQLKLVSNYDRKELKVSWDEYQEPGFDREALQETVGKQLFDFTQIRRKIASLTGRVGQLNQVTYRNLLTFTVIALTSLSVVSVISFRLGQSSVLQFGEVIALQPTSTGHSPIPVVKTPTASSSSSPAAATVDKPLTPTILSNLPRTTPVLGINKFERDGLITKGGSEQIKLTTQLQLKLDEFFNDTASIIELRTTVPPLFIPESEAWQPAYQPDDNTEAKSDRLQNTYLQSVPFRHIDPQNIIFESYYTAEWPQIRPSVYTITIQAELKGENGQPLSSAKRLRVVPINSTPTGLEDRSSSNIQFQRYE